ncbi:hypothetical protein OsI_22402 [Oryza sativa Indica Group]|uniref:Uncharacterized protein n=1 Tax=Oryza sativa subsp. indica TaxID=39946 RepID=B8B0A4_ORYSI|nr:hypothetical protein OsI_22402 [Oryza sativa Indica Group]
MMTMTPVEAGRRRRRGGGSDPPSPMWGGGRRRAVSRRGKLVAVPVGRAAAGIVAIGCDYAFARDFAAPVHAGLGPKTSPKDAPLPHLSIYIKNIYKGMHGSDTGALDAKGRFVPAKFEEIFSKHAKNRPDALTSLEVKEMILANRDPDDPQSWAAPIQEWGLIYSLASDKNGYFHKDSVRGIYDGSVFVKLEEERASSQSTVCRSLSFRSTV